MISNTPVSRQCVVSVGEILWDVMGNQRLAGGAPFNFASHCHNLGARAALISRISHDELGSDLLRQATMHGINCDHIQRDELHATGVVTAVNTGNGTIQYTFPHECAWDHIVLTEADLDLLSQATVVNFGTLAQRHPNSRATILGALSAAAPSAIRYLDLNLRAPYYDFVTVRQSLDAAHVLKLNSCEFASIQAMLHLSTNDGDAVAELIRNHGLQVVLITMGAAGAVAFTADEKVNVDGYPVVTEDLIGCGDAFGAGFITQFASGASLTDALDFANVLGAYVATQRGGVPEYTTADLDAFRATLKSHALSQ